MAVVLSKTKSGFHATRAEVFIYKSRKYADMRDKKISRSTYLRFPVPSSVGISENTANPFSMEEVLGKGQVTIFSGDELRTLEVGELLWPREYDPSFCTSKPSRTPDEAASTIKKWKDQRSPVRVIIGEHAQLAMDCTIQDLTIDFERPGHIGDAWISFKLVDIKRQPFAVRKLRSSGPRRRSPSKRENRRSRAVKRLRNRRHPFTPYAKMTYWVRLLNAIINPLTTSITTQSITPTKQSLRSITANTNHVVDSRYIPA